VLIRGVLTQDVVGWLLCLATLSLPLLSSKVRTNQSLLLACWFALGLHHCAAILDCYFFRIPGGDGDAIQFQLTEAGELNTVPYSHFLGWVYHSVGTSQFLGCELSVVAFALSLLVFIQLVEWVGEERLCTPLVLMFGCLPSVVFHTSVTLRESYQILFVLLALWFLSQIEATPRRVELYVGFLLSTAILLKLQQGMKIYCLGSTAIAVSWVLLGKARSRGMLLVLASLVFMLTLSLHRVWSDAQGDVSASALGSTQFIDYAAHYREGVSISRANYGIDLDISSPGGFLRTAPQIFVMYMLAPFPWQATGLKDLYALLESGFRVWLILNAWMRFRDVQGQQRRNFLLIFSLFLFLEMLWSLGTVNWGQAIRHRIVAYGFLLLLGGGNLIRQTQRMIAMADR
jgi:hypothetical protein